MSTQFAIVHRHTRRRIDMDEPYDGPQWAAETLAALDWCHYRGPSPRAALSMKDLEVIPWNENV